MALSRKRNMRRDFEAFYADVLGDKDFRFDDAFDALAKGKLGPADEELLEEVRSLGRQGKAMPFDEGDIEDQNALIFVETFQGRQRTVVKMKVRPARVADSSSFFASSSTSVSRLSIALAPLGAATPYSSSMPWS